jgi:hypothetical protein
MRGEERELKEIVGVCYSGTGSTPEPRPNVYNKERHMGDSHFSNALDWPLLIEGTCPDVRGLDGRAEAPLPVSPGR